MTDEIPAALRRNKDNIAPFMRKIIGYARTAPPSPSDNPQETSQDWVPPWK